jgi:O-antigen/teichoic acid export membrane protein
MQNDLERFRSVYLRMARLVATANLPLVAGLFAVAPIFVVAVYGAKWAPSISLVRILCVVGAFEGVSTSSVVFFATGRLKLQLVWATLTVALQTLAFVLAVRHGLAAVAWSYVAVSPLVFLVPHLLANRLILLPNKSLLQAILPGLLASLLMGGIVAFAAASQPWFREKSLAELSALTCMGAVLYGVLLVAAGAILSGTVKGGVTWVLGKQLTASGSVSMSPRQ